MDDIPVGTPYRITEKEKQKGKLLKAFSFTKRDLR